VTYGVDFVFMKQSPFFQKNEETTCDEIGRYENDVEDIVKKKGLVSLVQGQPQGGGRTIVYCCQMSIELSSEIRQLSCEPRCLCPSNVCKQFPPTSQRPWRPQNGIFVGCVCDVEHAPQKTRYSVI
jgi:hypothetical protein